MVAVGIDLGTSNSVVAAYRRGRVESFPIEGRNLVPSCVALKPGGGLFVGAMAKTRSLIDPAQSVVAIKRYMGDREYCVLLGEEAYSPVDISAMILKKLADGAKERLREPVQDAVISVPAYFTNNQKEDTRLAGEKAGLKVLALVPEPTAAAIAYGLNQGKDQTIMVYDLGGGTFDLSILQIRGNKFEVKAIGGDHALGGEDFDRRLIDLLVTRLREMKKLPPTMKEADTLRLYMKLKETAEAAKKELSQADTVNVDVPDVQAGAVIQVKLTRAEYEAVIADLVEKTIKITMDVLKQAKLDPKQVDRIVLVGGSTRVPLIRNTLARKICEPYLADNVDEVVAHGAAIMAANLSAASEDLAPIEVTNITAHSLGIRADRDKFAVIVPRGTKLPVQVKKTFTTARDNADRTDVVIFQGEDEKCSNNQQIGGFGLTGIARARAGTPKIDVTFTVDKDDILNVNAVDRDTARSGAIQIERFEPKPYEPTQEKQGKDPSRLRFGTSQVGCDNAGKVLEQLGYRYQMMDHSDFRTLSRLKQYDLVFINCLADITQVLGPGLFLNATRNAPALRDFVSAGGILYVSDYALENISEAFPGRINFGRKGAGPKGSATATVVDDGLRAMVGKTVPINFNTIYAPVDSVTSECQVYLKKGSEPLLVSFQHGDGHVVYTSFHNGVQMSAQEKELFSYIIMQTIALATNTPLVEVAETSKRR
jgi:molecular chaperone DnaK